MWVEQEIQICRNIRKKTERIKAIYIW
jgi:hypothetical protein